MIELIYLHGDIECKIMVPDKILTGEYVVIDAISGLPKSAPAQVSGMYGRIQTMTYNVGVGRHKKTVSSVKFKGEKSA